VPALIDLFAGAGGLSLGLESAGFEPILAVESSDLAAETYFMNFVSQDAPRWRRHRTKGIKEQIASGLAIHPTGAVLDHLDSVHRLLDKRTHELDLLAGGPPCQGFSLAGLRNPNDQRNKLPFEFLRFVEALQPRAVLIENVSGMGMSFSRAPGSAPLEQLREALAEVGSHGYVAEVLHVNARDFGVAQNRPRIMVVGVRRDVVSKIDNLKRTERSRSPSAPEPASPVSLLARFRMAQAVPVPVEEALLDISGDRYCLNETEYASHGYARSLRYSTLYPRHAEMHPPDPMRPPNQDLRDHRPDVVLRFKLYIALAPYGITADAFGLAARLSADGDAARDQVQARLESRSVPIPLRMPDGTRILDFDGSDVGRSTAALTNAIMKLSTRKHSQRALNPHAPSPTMLSLPDDFVHYREPRTLTVREMARIQSFPDSFVFFGKVTTGAHRRRVEVPQYTQVGNAVPPLMAREIGSRLLNLLDVPSDAISERPGYDARVA
jgi:DNA (cytosine-5)-methyltransferase 1